MRHTAAKALAAVMTLTAATALAACTSADTSAPAAPSGLTAQAGSATSVHVMWQSPAPEDLLMLLSSDRCDLEFTLEALSVTDEGPQDVDA
ncbi:hypothetical protein AB0M99_34700, partial [Streptomyces sp. NPDC051183]